MSKTEGLLKQILEEQKRIGVLLGQQEKRIESIEERLKTEPQATGVGDEVLPPALLRLLKALSELKSWAGADELSKKVNLSRNLTSGYLARLREKGYIERSPNMDSSRSVRYVFRANLEKLPLELKRMMAKGA